MPFIPGAPAASGGFEEALQAAMRNRARTSGFTLMELLLVVVIMLLAAGLAIPSFVRSYRGAKLRTSARAIVMSHRYARAMAVLKQAQVATLFDKTRSQIEIVTTGGAGQDDRDKFLDGRAERTGVESIDEKAEAGAPPGPVSSELVRPLADGVHIVSFESEGRVHEYKNVYWVNYYANGMCDPYTIGVEDEYHKSATIEVDPLSGKAKVEYD